MCFLLIEATIIALIKCDRVVECSPDNCFVYFIRRGPFLRYAHRFFNQGYEYSFMLIFTQCC